MSWPFARNSSPIEFRNRVFYDVEQCITQTERISSTKPVG